jgi:serine/threonine-protein kinase HipA
LQNQLINSWLAQNGRPENSMNPVELLCFRNTLGILDATQLTVIKAFDIEIDNLISISRKMLSKEKFQTNLNEKDQNMLDILKMEPPLAA